MPRPPLPSPGTHWDSSQVPACSSHEEPRNSRAGGPQAKGGEPCLWHVLLLRSHHGALGVVASFRLCHRVHAGVTRSAGLRGPESWGHDKLGWYHSDPFPRENEVSQWSSAAAGPLAGAVPSCSNGAGVRVRRPCTVWLEAL